MTARARKIFLPGLLWLLTCLALLIASNFPAAALSLNPTQRILLLYSYQAVLPINLELDEAIRAALKGPDAEPQEFYKEYLDLAQFPDGPHRQRLLNFLQVNMQTGHWTSSSRWETRPFVSCERTVTSSFPKFPWSSVGRF